MGGHSGERPGGETLGKAGIGNLCCPVVVGRGVAAGVDGVLERLHEAVEVGAEAGGLPEVAGGVDQMPLALPPLGTTVLEPDLEEQKSLEFGERGQKDENETRRR